MKGDWLGLDYDLLRKNCCLFSKALVEKLGVGPVPGWVTNLAAAGATLHDGILKGKEYADKAAIMAKAKAGEFDEKPGLLFYRVFVFLTYVTSELS